MTRAWRPVALLAADLEQTETQVYKLLHSLGIVVFNENYHVLSYESTKGERAKGLSTSAGIGAINQVLRTIGAEIRQHLPGNTLNIMRNNRRATIRVYQNHGMGSTFSHKRGFIDDRRPTHMLFVSSPENVAWVVKREDAINYFKNPKQSPEHIFIPAGWEEHPSGCLTFKFVGGEPEQLKTASQLNL